MSTDIRQLVYLSEAQFELTGADIKDILNKSRSRNPDAGITGLLIYSDGIFIQVLEGDPDAVSELLARISDDSRHENVAVIADKTVENRTFDSWSMAFVEASAQDIRQRAGIDGMLDIAEVMEALGKDDSSVSKFLHGFALSLS